jgi:hypothetical protein
MKRNSESLAVTFPEIAKEADGWDPKEFDASSGELVRWKCNLGHTWETAINYRVKRNSKCPYCLNQKVWIGFNDFATTHPDLLKELVDSDGTDFVAGSTSRVCQWRCQLGHLYSAKPQNRTVRKQGCPICAGRVVLSGFNDLATTHPEIAKEAFDFDPTRLSSGSHSKVSWKCPKGHVYTSILKQRTTGMRSNCSVCSGDQVMVGVNDLHTSHPALAVEADGWDPKRYTAGHNKKLSWKCELGHKWDASPNSRTNMESNCPVCEGRKVQTGFNDLQHLFPDIARQANGWDPSLVLAGTHEKKEWVCDEGHTWKSVVKDRTSRGDGCPSCSKFGFDNNKDGWLYFLEHHQWGLLQIGITNFPKNRLKDHERLGWNLLEIKGPMDGLLARKWEKSILGLITNRGIKLGDEKIAGRYSGYTETWSVNELHVRSLKELMDLVDASEQTTESN